MSLLSDQDIQAALQKAIKTGCDYLEIVSRRQDIGIQKCEWGVARGYLTKEVIEPDDQSTIWRYRWTEKARAEWKQP